MIDQIRINTHSVLGNISSIFNQLEYLENRLKDNLNDIKTPFPHYPEKEDVTKGPIETGCTPLPDYILVTSVTTEVFPVHAIPCMVLDWEGEEQGWDIPVRVDNRTTRPVKSIL